MEPHEHRLKRLRIRSWRRGIKEMDLILGGFADDRMADLSLADLDAHETLMNEQDHDLYLWVSGQSEPPADLANAIKIVREYFLAKEK